MLSRAALLLGAARRARDATRHFQSLSPASRAVRKKAEREAEEGRAMVKLPSRAFVRSFCLNLDLLVVAVPQPSTGRDLLPGDGRGRGVRLRQRGNIVPLLRPRKETAPGRAARPFLSSLASASSTLALALVSSDRL